MTGGLVLPPAMSTPPTAINAVQGPRTPRWGRSAASSSAAPNGNLQFDRCLGSRRCRCFTPASSETARHSPRGDVGLRGVASHSFDLASSISGVTLSGSMRTIT